MKVRNSSMSPMTDRTMSRHYTPELFASYKNILQLVAHGCKLKICLAEVETIMTSALLHLTLLGAKCSSEVRAFAHGMIGCRITLL